MAVPLEVLVFFFTDIPKVSGKEEEAGREEVREGDRVLGEMDGLRSTPSQAVS